MKKPRNRKERISFIVSKQGRHIESCFTYMTDKEVKTYFDSVYKSLKDKDDYIGTEPAVSCIRCGNTVKVEHHHYCMCGEDRAVFDDNMWKTDILDYSECQRIAADKEFIKNGFCSSGLDSTKPK